MSVIPPYIKSLYYRFLKLDPLEFLSVTIILFILRMAAPYVNHVFIPCFLLYSIFTFGHYLRIFKSFRHDYVLKSNLYPLVVSAFFIWGFAITSSFVLPSFKELLSIVIILFLVLSLYIFIHDRDSYQKFIKVLIKQFIIFSIIISLLGLTKCYLQLRDIELTFLKLPVKIAGTSLTTDYNFYTLFIIIGIISLIIWLLSVDLSSGKSRKFLYAFILLILSFNILFSFSRRGLIVIVILIPLILGFIIYGYLKKKEYWSVFSIYLFAFICLILLQIAFMFRLPVDTRKIVLHSIRVPVSSYKDFTASLLYRYSTVFNETDYLHMVSILWTEKPNPLDPDSGWGPIGSTYMFPLTGMNSEMIPEKSIGCKMDNNSQSSTWNNNAYSYTDIKIVFEGDTVSKYNEFYYASVYCYVSEDFDGNWARISTEEASNGKMIHEYDMKNKGQWQKLNIFFQNSEKIPPVYLYWAKNGATDFKDLKGHIIFAYPEYKTIKADPGNPFLGWGSRDFTPEFPLTGQNIEIVPENSVGYRMDKTCNASTWNGNAFSYSEISCLFQGDMHLAANKSFFASVYCYVSDDFNGTWARISAEGDAYGQTINEYDMNRKGVWQKLQINFSSKSGIPPVYLYWSKYGVTDFQNLKGYVIFAYPEYFTSE